MGETHRGETGMTGGAGESRRQFTGERTAEEARRSAGEPSESTKDRLAGRIDQTSERLEQRATRMEEQGGMAGMAGKAMHRASDAMETGADYLQSHGARAMRDDVTSQIRQHPYLSVGAALGAGFVLGRILGGGEREEVFEPKRRRGREFRKFRERGMAEGGMGRIRRAILGGLGVMLARRVRKRVAGR